MKEFATICQFWKDVWILGFLRGHFQVATSASEVDVRQPLHNKHMGRSRWMPDLKRVPACTGVALELRVTTC